MEHAYTVAGSPDAVMAAHRDDLPEFATQLPGIAGAVETERARVDGRDRRVHHWQGDAAGLPRVLARFLRPEQFQWFDRSEWDPSTRIGTWTLTAPALGDGPHVVGSHRFEPDPDGTRVVVEARVALPDTLTFLGVPVPGWTRRSLEGFMQHLLSRVVAFTGSAVSAHLTGREADAA